MRCCSVCRGLRDRLVVEGGRVSGRRRRMATQRKVAKMAIRKKVDRHPKYCPIIPEMENKAR